jgi:membrane-associated phospholipid phosphatase
MNAFTGMNFEIKLFSMSLNTRYFITVLFSLSLGVLHLVTIAKPIQNYTLTLTVIALAAFASMVWLRPNQRKRWIIPLTLTLGMTVPVYYVSSGQAIQALELHRATNAIMKIEQTLFKPFFTDGHISLALDRNAVLNPQAPLGKVLTEFFQIMYFSYYLWGFLLMALGIYWVRKDYKENHLYLMSFTCTWIGAFTLNYLFYMIVPVIGPELTLSGRYKNPLEGIWVAPWIHRLIDDGHTTLEDCFPSGHVALSWVTAFLALRVLKGLGRVLVFCAVSVTLATLYLRYHYIVDVIAAVPLVWLAMKWGEYDRFIKRAAKTASKAASSLRARRKTR